MRRFSFLAVVGLPSLLALTSGCNLLTECDPASSSPATVTEEAEQPETTLADERGDETEPTVTAASLGFTEVVSDQIAETGERVIGLTNEAQDEVAVAVVTEEVTYLLRFNDEAGEISWDLLNDLGVVIATVFPDFIQLADGAILSVSQGTAKSVEDHCAGVNLANAADTVAPISRALYRCSETLVPPLSNDERREFVQRMTECLMESSELELIKPICSDIAGVDPVTCDCLCGSEQTYDASTDSCQPASTPAPTISPTATPTPAPSTKPTATPSPTPSPSAEPTATPSPSPSPSPSPGVITDYAYRKSIAIDHTRVGLAGTDRETLTNFPLLVSVVDADLRSSPGGHVSDPSGGDIAFYAVDDDTCGGAGLSPCEIDHEIEGYDPATGQLVAWIRVPQVATANPFVTTDSVIYLYYGNPDLAASAENSSGVWGEHYQGVWHLGEEQPGIGNPLLYRDSTSNDNGLDDQISAEGETGKIGWGQEFDGVDDYASRSPIVTPIVGNLTVSTWFRSTFNLDSIRLLDLAQSSQGGLQLVLNSTGIIRIDNSGGPNVNVESNPGFNDGEWHYVAAARSGSTYRLYVNGEFVASGDGTGPDYTRLFLGKQDSGGHFEGDLDEVRVSTAVLTADVIRAEYNNQQWPNKHNYPDHGFITLGVEEPNPD
jgi:hypothetical protein